jgi:acetylglutamate kinase
MDKLIGKARILVEALPYIQEFRGALVVIKFGGSAMEDPKLTAQIMRDAVLLEAIGMRPVVVHGGGNAISAELKNRGIETRFINGLRQTCAESVKIVDDVLHNTVNASLLEHATKYGGSAKQISGKDILQAEKMYSKCPDTGENIDIGFVGSVTEVDIGPILTTVEEDIIPIIPPLAIGEDGAVYNVNADIAACRIAAALKARKLVFLSDVPGILRDPADESTLVSSVNKAEVMKMIDDGTISGGMIPKVMSCLHALEAGTSKVHMVDGRVPHALLLEIFTDSGIGTEIVN